MNRLGNVTIAKGKRDADARVLRLIRRCERSTGRLWHPLDVCASVAMMHAVQRLSKTQRIHFDSEYHGYRTQERKRKD